MADIQVSFNKPARKISLERLIADMLAARDVLVMASAWFTNRQIADALIASEAKRKGVILNQADLDRPNKYGNTAVELVTEYFNKVYFADIPYEVDPRQRDLLSCEGLVVLGSGDWKEGVMHHKFIVADTVTWTGSYNFTFQAANNYENLLRIDDADIAALYIQEAAELQEEWLLFTGSTQVARTKTAFRCFYCEKIFPAESMGKDYDTWYVCKQCATTEGR